MLLSFSDRHVWTDSVDPAQTAGFVTLHVFANPHASFGPITLVPMLGQSQQFFRNFRIFTVLSYFIDESGYLLQDLSGEAELKCSLQESVRRARTQPLFAVSWLGKKKKKNACFRFQL